MQRKKYGPYTGEKAINRNTEKAQALDFLSKDFNETMFKEQKESKYVSTK